ncbi:DUF502 domain-containing protein [Defluviicoccus vanus]|uniref:DUF502 domain-containing protein n=1 Tax=Defluviicoccus vanus TaxID=111831 RepID=A0A7H1N1E0_9PROT|nr:DUF502 domain-containing protein [Defluviicoccus vanus]QNT69526.1 DUF502 domain-containing protein [Defluviicoccus vanus]
MATGGSGGLHAGKYILTGILTIIPLWVSLMVFEFVLGTLSSAGLPWLRLLANRLRVDAPLLADWLTRRWVDELLAAIITLVGLYLIGWFATQVVGRRIIGFFERQIARIPLLSFVYSAVKKLTSLLQDKQGSAQRVVIVNFPNDRLKCVGLLMKTMTDATNGNALAAVYVPTAPNPTSGYLEIVPMDQVITTDWTVDQAMNFVISMGAIAPDHVHYTRDVTAPV